MYYCGLCVIARDEHRYIREWIDYYILIGIDHFYITDHKSNPPMLDVLQDYIDHKIVTYKYDERPSPQITIYNECLQQYGSNNKWIAFFDSDEFLVLKQHSSIKDFLVNYEAYGAVSVAWYLFGSNGHVEKQPSVIQAFTQRFPISCHYKTIVQPKAVEQYIIHHVGEHKPDYYTVDEGTNRINGPCTINQLTYYVQLNHYIVRSHKDYIDKINRGCADGTPARPREWFDIINKGATVTDTTIITRIKEIEGLKLQTHKILTK